MEIQEKDFSIGDWILWIRQNLMKMNRDRFAMMLGVHVTQVFKWEKNKNPMSKTAKYLFLDQIKNELQNQNYDWSYLPNGTEWQSWVDDDYKSSRGWLKKGDTYELPPISPYIENNQQNSPIYITDTLRSRKSLEMENIQSHIKYIKIMHDDLRNLKDYIYENTTNVNKKIELNNADNFNSEPRRISKNAVNELSKEEGYRSKESQLVYDRYILPNVKPINEGVSPVSSVNPTKLFQKLQSTIKNTDANI